MEKIVWSYYAKHARHMPWRDNTSLYYVVISEIMLQQTQVDRVMKKFPKFVKRFPDWQALAEAPIKAVLMEWSGLGYNRRALYVKRIGGRFAALTDIERQKIVETEKLPGIGSNTRGSILAFAFNRPVPFIETNIRSVFIHFFFKNRKKKVADSEIMPLLIKTLAKPKIKKNPREWYWALMDYGTHLKSILPNPSRRSAHHTRQKPFIGSNRELRSAIIKSIMKRPGRIQDLLQRFRVSNGSTTKDARDVGKNLADLAREGFIYEKNGLYHISR